MIWDLIEYFSPNESWGDPSKVSGILILTMDAVRGAYGEEGPSFYSFVLHCGYELSGHSNNSLHYVGKAVDFHVRDKSPLRKLYFRQVHRMIRVVQNLQIADYVGLGIYPQWRRPGFHLDVRGTKARWGWLDKKQVSFKNALAYAEEKEIMGP